MPTAFRCSRCSEHAGYGVLRGRKICFACCAQREKRSMRLTGKTTLYDDQSADKRGVLINWPGNIRIQVTSRRKGNHNIAGARHDLWFRFDGQDWHGVRYGDNTQIVHCRRLKAKKTRKTAIAKA